MDEFAAEKPDDVRTWSVRIKRAARRREAQVVTLLIKSAAPIAAVVGRLDLVASWLHHLPSDAIEHDVHLLYWSGASIALTHPSDAYPRLLAAFATLRHDPDGNWSLLAWAGLADVIFLLYRDLHELDQLIAWMTPEREADVDRMPRPMRSLVVGSALFALSFRQPMHPRLPAWRDRAERLVEHDPTSNLGARLTAGLIVDYTWRGDLAAAEIVWKRFDARAARAELSALGKVLRSLNEATLRLHQGRLDECVAAVAVGLAASSLHGLRVWDGVMHCLAVSAYVSSGAVVDARRHLSAIEQLFAEGIPVDEAYYRAMLFWCDFVAGDRLGVVSRCTNVLELTDIKGVPYFQAVCRIMNGLMLFESGHHDRGRALLAEGIARGRELENPLLLWIGGLFEAHIHYTAGEKVKGDLALEFAMRLGRDHYLAHFFCWPRKIIAGLIDRALERGYSTDYLTYLVTTHAFTPGDVPTRSDQWAFPVRIYMFGNPRVVHADGRIEHLSAQFQRQIELLATLIARPQTPVAIQSVAADIYEDEEVDPVASVKRVLHSLRARVGQAVVQRNASLALDFEKVWIDACGFQWFSHEVGDAVMIETWLDRHYHDHFMAQLAHSSVVERLRRRLADQAEHAIRGAIANSVRTKDDATVRRLDARWQPLFPHLFDTLGR